MQLRVARSEDAEFLYRLREDGFRPYVEQVFGPWVEAVQRPMAEREFAELPVQIVELAGAAVGYLAVIRADDHWYLDEVAIVAEHRDRGLGTQLVRDIMEGARAAGFPLRLSVLHVNPAQQLYARLGFRVTRIEHPRVKMEWP